MQGVPFCSVRACVWLCFFHLYASTFLSVGFSASSPRTQVSYGSCTFDVIKPPPPPRRALVADDGDGRVSHRNCRKLSNDATRILSRQQRPAAAAGPHILRWCPHIVPIGEDAVPYGNVFISGQFNFSPSPAGCVHVRKREAPIVRRGTMRE